ncbi:hypothetical protein BGZ60DRAFT_550008 [Tricladium varicosporioides]|nr:hypothetical protein BGZ60DRAFT_550008 [Hymenoscyphus varicosporioides]
MGKKIETPSSLHEKIGTTEVVKFLFSLVILGLAAAVVHRSKGQLHYAASWSLTVSLVSIALGITGILCYQHDKKTIMRVVGGVSTTIWLSASVWLLIAAGNAKHDLIGKRSDHSIDYPQNDIVIIVGRAKWGKIVKGAKNAAENLSSISYACGVFCAINFIACLMQWYYDFKASSMERSRKAHDPEAVPLDDSTGT